jgi:glycosyltransferase involved in cell wall biosynthesis
MTHKNRPHISIVSPVYGAERIIPELIERIESSVCTISNDFEIILVEDCGPDNSWGVIESLSLKNERIKSIKLSRNFGQHYAITCALDHAEGSWIVVMDCDLQDRPEEIPRLYELAISSDADIVLAKRINRKDAFVNQFTSKIFYFFLEKLTGWKYDSSVANFGIYSKKVIDDFVQMREPIRVFPVMINWLGHKTQYLTVNHAERKEGKSSYTFRKRMKLALEIILAYSDKPLRILLVLGILISISSVIFAFYFMIIYFLGYIKVSGYTSLIVSLWFLSGLIIFTLGIVGLYVGKVFDSVKKRPLYIVSKKINI